MNNNAPFDENAAPKNSKIQNFRPLSKNRPGRKARIADSELSPAEREKREVRRIRNKQAARRCRQRRLEKTFNLEQKVSARDPRTRADHLFQVHQKPRGPRISEKCREHNF